MWIDWIEVKGPLQATDTRSILAGKPGEAGDARDIIERFALRAFRDNPPQPGYIDKLVKLFEARLKAGDPFEQAIREPLGVVLASLALCFLLSKPIGAYQLGETYAQNLGVNIKLFQNDIIKNHF